MGNEEIVIRRLGSGDDDLAMEVAIRFGRGMPEGSEHVAGYLEDAEHNLLMVALSGSRPIGFARACWLSRLDLPHPQLLLYDIEVVDDCRRRGTGRLLIEALQEACRERDALEMFVITERSNLAAMSLYGSTGGKQPNEDDVVFVYPFH